ncbi:hypothetical protein Forpe1208_v008799 [Fusarium oxysporum f. sp. rapae]|uniref:Uncharacterized protein n=1 Tax=Fusarium oxysporum f. sp. rapae TaxID=485398 RepID=A0A8J5P4W2_FUSOX|nr:hypothetical protein Forpe1208_v008799 [Fusarium oxysporum f. sp. rapae]
MRSHDDPRKLQFARTRGTVQRYARNQSVNQAQISSHLEAHSFDFPVTRFTSSAVFHATLEEKGDKWLDRLGRRITRL